MNFAGSVWIGCYILIYGNAYSWENYICEIFSLIESKVKTKFCDLCIALLEERYWETFFYQNPI